MIGNGFDLNMGLNTSYYSFYKWYCEINTTDDDIKLFKDSIKNYIKNIGNTSTIEEESTWCDFELGLGKYTSQIDDVNVFIKCYNDACKYLIDYIENENTKFNGHSVKELLISGKNNGLIEFYSELPPSEKTLFDSILHKRLQENVNFKFVNFNYTDFFDQYLQNIPKSVCSWSYYNTIYHFQIDSNVIHVHGTIDEFPIIGVCDINDITNDSFRKNKDLQNLLVKNDSVNAIGRFWYKRTKEYIDNSQIICIYGMSIGKTDSFWWNYIANWLKNNNQRHLLIYWKDFNYKNNRLRSSYLSNINMVKNNFISYSNLTEEEKINVISRIHVIINTTKVFQREIEKFPNEK